ncbi:MAG: YbgA family protein [Proteobacteria bacterium]|nr:YbgA family protein [Pseudomonadota bacterium]
MDAEFTALAELVLDQWREFVAARPSRGGLVKFHTCNKFLILAHSEFHYRQLGPLVAAPRAIPLDELIDRYGQGLAEALSRTPSRGSHVNVLQHLAGMCKKALDPHQQKELVRAIEAYGAGQVPLDVPRDLLRHHAHAIGQTYVLAQSYLAPSSRWLARQS